MRIGIIILSFLVISISPAFAQEHPPSEFWESLSVMPTPRTEVVAIPVDEKIFVIGGFDRNGKGTDIVEYMIL